MTDVPNLEADHRNGATGEVLEDKKITDVRAVKWMVCSFIKAGQMKSYLD